MNIVVSAITHQTRVGNVPVLGGVLAEELVTITGAGFAPDARVRAQDLAESPILPKHNLSTATEIQVFLPNTEAMESSANYKRNAIVTSLTIVVENPGKHRPKQVSDPWTIPILLGPPRVNAPPALKGKKVSFGSAPTKLIQRDAVDDLGVAGGPGVDDGLGQVWFYPKPPRLPVLPPPTHLPGAAESITLPSLLSSKLAKIRKSGTRLKVGRGNWNDDSLTAELPHIPIDGTIIVWRDDIPSRPVRVVSLLPPGVTCAQVQDTLGRMFKLNPDPGTPVVLGLGQSLPLGVTSLPTSGLDPVIVNLLGTLTIEFAFKVTGLAPEKVRTSGSNTGPNPVPSSLKTGSLMVCPDLFPQERSAPAPQAFTVQLLVSVSIPDCPQGVQAAGDLLQCQQLPLGVPTVAVFFEDVNFQGPPMIVLPRETTIIDSGQEIDDNNSGPLLNARRTVGNSLATLALACEFLSIFAGVASIPGADEISLLSDLVERINDAGHLVINSVGKMDHLEDAVVEDGFLFFPDDDFDDAASSMIMVGSVGFGRLRGFRIDSFADEEEGGRKVTWSLPSDHIIAATPDFTHMNTPHVVNGGTAIALPYGGGPAPTDDFNDEMGSLVVVSN